MLKLLFKFFSKTTPVASQRLFIEVIKEYIDKKSVENCLTEGAIKKNEYAYNNITLFLHSEQSTTMTLDGVRNKTMEQLRYWLHKNLATCSAEHTSRHINLCKAAMRYAIRMEYIHTSPIETVETRRDKPKEVIYLNENEIKKLTVYQFPRDVHRIAADLYLFQSFTGLSYADLYCFKIINEGGMNWIVGESGREKNGVAYHVPLFDAAKELLNKYNGQIPYLCNQTYNRHLKSIARALNINKNLTTHTARKTFATLKDQEGWSIDSIADMMGNTPEIARKHYVNHSKKRVESEFLRLAVG